MKKAGLFIIFLSSVWPQKNPEFGGKISKTGTYPGTISFSKSDFTANYSQNDGDALSYISISGSNLTVGALQLSGSNYDFGDLIDVSSLDNLTFATKKSGTVSYTVSVYTENDTGTPVGTAVLTINASSLSVPSIEDAIEKTISAGDLLSFSSTIFTNCCDLSDGTLESIEITPENSVCGVWYADGDEFTDTTEVSSSEIGALVFKGTAAGNATFSWRVANEAGYSGYGTGTIAVSSPELSLASYTASSKILKGDTYSLSSSHFYYSPSSITPSYVKIVTIPNKSDGYLYLTTALARNSTYGYSAISANKALSAKTVVPYSYLKYLRLATKSSSENSSLSFTWTATADSIIKTAAWASAANYTVKFVTAGTIRYSTAPNISVSLDGEAFSKVFDDEVGYTLSHITFTLPSSTYGKLYLNYDSTTKTGTAVSAKTKYYVDISPRISDVTFVPADDYNTDIEITYEAYTDDDEHAAGTLVINMSENDGGTVGYTTDKNCAIQLDAGDFAEAFRNATDETLKYVKFTLPSSSYGKLYYEYSSSSDYDSTVSSSKKYYVYSSPYLSYVTFVPAEDYIGTVSVTFTGYSTGGTAYRGKAMINVQDSAGGIVFCATGKNTVLTLSGDDFADEFIASTGSVLSYIKFTPPDKTVGILYYEYSADTGKGSKVTAKTAYYYDSAPNISDISFVPADGYLGTLTISYTAYSWDDDAYTGKLKITIGETTAGTVTYETGEDTPVTLHLSDFMSEFSKNTDSSLSYMTFALPSASYGKLYYSYTSASSYGSAVSEGTKYYVNSSPYLSNIAFVPKSGYSGSFTVTYKGYDAAGTGYAGKLKIIVGNTDVGTVNYETRSNTAVTFDTSDFNTAFQSEAGESFSYVRFTLPPSSCGKLYYNYISSSSYTSAVSATLKYYRRSSPYLSGVAFVPHANYSGTVTIEYQAYTSDGEAYPGTVVITVNTASESTAVGYETLRNESVTLDADDFNSVFEEETGKTLSYVKFTLPSSSYGKLYYDYTSLSDYDSKVSATTKYYRIASPYLSKITFVPSSDYIGVATIAYSGYTSGGSYYSGNLYITVSDTQPFSDVRKNYSWASDAIEYLYDEGVVAGTGNGGFSPQKSISRGDFVLMICRAFDLSSNTLSNFSDVDSGSYYYDAIATAKSLGIAKGSGNRFYPNAALTREDAMVILSRALSVTGRTLAAGKETGLSDFSDGNKVSDYAASAVSALVKAGIITGSNGALHPQSSITRAEMSVILFRILTMPE